MIGTSILWDTKIKDFLIYIAVEGHSTSLHGSVDSKTQPIQCDCEGMHYTSFVGPEVEMKIVSCLLISRSDSGLGPDFYLVIPLRLSGDAWKKNLLPALTHPN